MQRARIVVLLAKGEMNVGEIAGKLNIGSSTMSIHTKSLKKAGLIEISRRGRTKTLRLTSKGWETYQALKNLLLCEK